MEGEHISNPRHLSKYEDKLAKLQKKLVRKEEGSNNWHKFKKKIAKGHEKIFAMTFCINCSLY